MAQWVKNPAANAGDVGSIRGSAKIPWWEGMATHSGILAWSIPVDRGAWGGAGSSSWGRRESDTTEAAAPAGTVTVLRCPSLHHPSTVTRSGRWGATHVVSPGSPLCCDACLLRPAPHPLPPQPPTPTFLPRSTRPGV